MLNTHERHLTRTVISSVSDAIPDIRVELAALAVAFCRATRTNCIAFAELLEKTRQDVYDEANPRRP